MDTKKPFPSAILAGACFAIMAFLALSNFLRFHSFINIMYLLALIVLAIAFFMEKRDILPIGGFALLALTEVISFFSTMSYKFTVHNWLLGETKFNFFTLIPSLLQLTAFLSIFVLVLLALNDILGEDLKKKIRDLWLVPAGLLLAAKIFGIILQSIFMVLGNSGWQFGYVYAGTFFTDLILAAGFLFAAMYICYPDGLSKKSFAFDNQSHPYAENNSFSEGGSDNMNNTSGNTYDNSYNPYNVDIRQAYFSIIAHILLLLFTFGIWPLVWIYRTTKYLNCVPGEEYRNPTTKLLLCMFVPFYIWYWTYKTGQRVDKLSESKGMASDLAIICLLLAIFIGIIPPILLQDRINNIVDIMNGKTVAGAAYHQAYQQTYQQPQPSAQQPQQNTANSQAAANQSAPQQVPYAAPTTATQTVASQPISDLQTVTEPTITPTTQSTSTPEVAPVPQVSETPAVPVQIAPSAEMATVEEIKAYKELLDMGAITQEEFDAKKKQLLGL